MTSQAIAGSSSERAFVLVCYLLHLFGAIAGVPSVLGLVINYLKRADAGPLLESHHRWMIRSFWWALVWILIGIATWVILIGWVVLGVAWLWYVYRHVRGLVRLANGEPMPV